MERMNTDENVDEGTQENLAAMVKNFGVEVS